MDSKSGLMSIDTKKRKKKPEKKEASIEKIESESIPSDQIPNPSELIRPPKPITFKEGERQIPRPTRLPPRFKQRLSKKSTVSKQPSTKSNLKPTEDQPKTSIKPHV